MLLKSVSVTAHSKLWWVSITVLLLHVLPTAAAAASGAPLSRIRSEYTRLRNIDPSGDNQAHQSSWQLLAAQMRGALVQKISDSDSVALRVIAAEALSSIKGAELSRYHSRASEALSRQG